MKSKSILAEKIYPILEFDNSLKSLIKPGDFNKSVYMSEYCVICSFGKVLNKLKKAKAKKFVHKNYLKVGGAVLYELVHKKKKIVIANLPIGAPLAVLILEELIVSGCSKIIACGSAGVINKDIPSGHIIIPDSAVRDEGTSYHYIHPDREAKPHRKAFSVMKKTCKQLGISYRVGKTWTTDAVFRETIRKIKKRKEEGCLTVEMEAAAFFAVAEFRKVIFGQFLYCLDDISGKKWDSRKNEKPQLSQEDAFWLAVEACIRL